MDTNTVTADSILTWESNSSTYPYFSNIWATIYNLADGWSAASLIENDDSWTASGAAPVVEGGGNYVVVWTQGDTIRWNLWANCYTAGVGWGVEKLIETYNIYNQLNFDVASNKNNTTLVAWAEPYNAVYINWLK